MFALGRTPDSELSWLIAAANIVAHLSHFTGTRLIQCFRPRFRHAAELRFPGSDFLSLCFWIDSTNTVAHLSQFTGTSFIPCFRPRFRHAAELRFPGSGFLSVCFWIDSTNKVAHLSQFTGTHLISCFRHWFSHAADLRSWQDVVRLMFGLFKCRNFFWDGAEFCG
jgi:hypothetical protein